MGQSSKHSEVKTKELLAGVVSSVVAKINYCDHVVLDPLSLVYYC